MRTPYTVRTVPFVLRAAASVEPMHAMAGLELNQTGIRYIPLDLRSCVSNIRYAVTHANPKLRTNLRTYVV